MRNVGVERDLEKDEPARATRIEAKRLLEEAGRLTETAKALDDEGCEVQSAFFLPRNLALVSDREFARRTAVNLFNDDHSLARLAENILTDRALRKSHFPGELFSEPAWDILLCLFVADTRKSWLSEVSVCTTSGAPRSTAMRWINFMKKAGIIEKMDASNSDKPANFRITPYGAAQMRNYLKSILNRV